MSEHPGEHRPQAARAVPLGFRVVGPKWRPRKLVIHDNAFAAAVAADASSYPEAESYLSANSFGLDFFEYLGATGSTAKFKGNVGAMHLNFDIDSADLTDALAQVRRLVFFMADRYGLDLETQVFFSGKKGFHVCIPAGLFGVIPSPALPSAFKVLAKRLAAECGAGIDEGIYDAVRLFRTPNSRHPDTGLHKIPLDFDTLLYSDSKYINRLARSPQPAFAPDPADAVPHQQAVQDYREAAAGVSSPTPPGITCRGGGKNINPARERRDWLDAKTLEFVAAGAGEGSRNNRLFAAAKAMADCGGVSELTYALLREPADRLGVAPFDVARVTALAAAGAAGGRTFDVPPAPDTRAFLRGEIDRGDRDRLLAAAAADLAAYRSHTDLAVAVLAGPALDCRMPPAEIRRVFRNALGVEVSCLTRSRPAQ